MRVGIFTYGMRQELTGIGRYTVELVRQLGEFPSVDPVLLNPYPDSFLPIYKEFPQVAVPTLSKLPAVLLKGPRVLDRIAQRERLDILHDPCGIAPFTLRRPSSSSYGRVVTVHDAIPFLYPQLQPLLTKLTFQTRVRWSRFSADAIVTVSQSAKHDLVEFGRLPTENIHIAQPGIVLPSIEDIHTWRHEKDVLTRLHLAHPYFLYVGSINPRKNIHRVLTAFEQVTQIDPRLQLVLAGPRRTLPRRESAMARKLADNVIFTGYLDEHSLHVLYANAVAVVYPSLYEGFGFPVLEGMAHSTPVISSTTSSIPEVAGQSALLVDPTNPAEIAHAMELILSDRSLCDSLGESGYERAQKFSWKATAERTLDIYNQVLESVVSR